MKAMENFSIALGFLGWMGISAIAAHPASASDYASTSKATTLRLDEKNMGSTDFYSTLINGRTWQGEIKVDRREESPLTLPPGEGVRIYYGTFRDNPDRLVTTIDGKWKCTGTIKMTRVMGSQSRAKPGAELRVQWQVTGGNQCPNMGKSYNLSLAESLPPVNSKGDYLESWQRWRVVSADGELNCRQTPNGKIVRVFKSNQDEIVPEGRSGNAITTYFNGDPWLSIPASLKAGTQACYVRANSRFIQPISVPW